MLKVPFTDTVDGFSCQPPLTQIINKRVPLECCICSHVFAFD